MLAGQYEFDENQTARGYNDGTGVMDYNADVIAHLDTTEDVLDYNIIAPYSKDTRKLSIILYEIMEGRDVTDEESDFLDSIDSRFIGHKEYNELTKREILCLFLNQYWDWSSPQITQIKNVSVSTRELFKSYSKFCGDNRFGKTRRLKKAEFDDYMCHYGYYHRKTKVVNGKKFNYRVIEDLPAYKDDLKEIPEFDLQNMIE